MATKRRLAAGLVLTSVVILGTTGLRASDPVGIYCLAQRVVLSPNDTAPQSIQIWGAFALSDGKPGGGYLPPVAGYLYYRCAPGQDGKCLTEWTDLKKGAGPDRLLAIASRYAPLGHVRKAEEPLASPDAYPSGVPVTVIPAANADPQLLGALRKALKGGR